MLLDTTITASVPPPAYRNIMDPTPLDPAATASPPASAAGSPLIFALTPPHRREDEVTMHFYAPNADVMEDPYGAILHFAAAYGYSLGIYQCPDLAAFRAANPTANVRPFSEVPAIIIAMGREVMFS